MLKPTYKIEYNEKNITKDVSAYVLSLEYSDYEHGTSDEITITFEDTDIFLKLFYKAETMYLSWF